MNAQHTQGRLVVNPIQLDQIATADGSMEVARVRLHSGQHDITIANARRLVVCWNAGEGLSTEQIDLIADHCDALKSQRDKLLATLQEVLDCAKTQTSIGAVMRARAAIASVTGKEGGV